jgi:hypothetical protein
MNTSRASLYARALVGVVLILGVGSLFLFFPLALHWLRDHRGFDCAAIFAGSLFHWWNTFKARPPYV